jgi:hypothetical protein
MIKKINYRSWGLLIAGIIIFASGSVYWVSRPVPSPQPAQNVITTKAEPKPKEVVIPETKIIPVPYTVQAPYAKWSIHEESCEEAAVLMYHYFLLGSAITDIDPTTADAELTKLRNWQLNNWGPEKDLDLSTLGQLSKQYYGYQSKIKTASKEEIKKEIASGSPLMVPVMTHSLQNPHYGRNNTYHILLINGYDQTGVFANDAGVKEGKNWHYSWEILFGAIDAQTPKMGQGREMLILTK